MSPDLAPRRVIWTLAALCALAAPSAAQYATDFEALSATPGGTILTGQDNFYLPTATGSLDQSLYTYAGNVLGIAPNPFGGLNFAAGVGPGSSLGTLSYRRAQRDISYGPGAWSLAFDVCATFGGALPAADNIGSFSIQPHPGSQAFIALARWQVPATATAWKADYVYVDAVGTTIYASVPDPAFQNLAVNQWYRWETIVDFNSNLIVRVRITDLTTLATAAWSPPNWYLLGGAAGSVPPTGFRLFAGSSIPGNTLAFDNITIAPAPPEWQLNQPASSFDIDGVQAGAYAPARVPKCFGTPASANFSSANAGQGFDLAINFSPIVPIGGGALPTPGGQIVNLDLSGGLPIWLNGGLTPLPVPFPPAPISVGFTVPSVPGSISAQLVVGDPGSGDGIALSQASEVNMVPSGPVAGPTGDDTAVAVTFAAAPLCGPALIPFYGTLFTQMQVISNGRIMFGPPNVSFSPAVSTSLTDPPSAGPWVDLSPNLNGTITVTAPTPSSVRVDWVGVANFGTPGTSNTFGIQIDTSGNVVFDGLLGINPGASTMLLGLSAGNLGATDPGATVFSLGANVVGPAGMGMLYQLGPTGTLAAGVNLLTFTPNANPNYDWSGL